MIFFIFLCALPVAEFLTSVPNWLNKGQLNLFFTILRTFWDSPLPSPFFQYYGCTIASLQEWVLKFIIFKDLIRKLGRLLNDVVSIFFVWERVWMRQYPHQTRGFNKLELLKYIIREILITTKTIVNHSVSYYL